MGFSFTGTAIALVMLIPSLLLLFFPPKNVPAGKKGAGIVLTVLERAGQAGIMVILILSNDSFKNARTDSTWFFMMVLCAAVYYALCVRYYINGRAAAYLYKPLLSLPVPMAVFPVFVFAFAGVWGNSLLLLGATVIFAVGHIANSLHRAKRA